MKKIVFLLFNLSFFFGCSKDGYSKLPKCLLEKINANEIHPSSTITRYTTQSGFVFENYNGDGADVYNEECTIICFLGGFVGNTVCAVDGDTLVLTDPVIVWGQ